MTDLFFQVVCVGGGVFGLKNAIQAANSGEQVAMIVEDWNTIVAKGRLFEEALEMGVLFVSGCKLLEYIEENGSSKVVVKTDDNVMCQIQCRELMDFSNSSLIAEKCFI